MRRRTIAAAVIAAAAVAHTAAWVVVQRQVANGFHAWVESQRAQGTTVDYAATATGWPLSAGIAARGLRIARPGLAWSAERADIVVRATDLLHVHVSPGGDQSLQSGSLQLHGRAATFDLALRLPTGDDPALTVTDVIIDLPTGSLDIRQLEASVLITRTADEPAVSFAASAAGIRLPSGPAYLLGPDIAELAVTGSLSPPVPPPGPLAQQAAAWRDGHGTARIAQLRLRWGKAAIDGAGTLALDRALQPVADLRVRLQGQDAALDAMAAQGYISARSAGAAKAVLALFGRAAPGPDGAPATLPVTLRDGDVSFGGFPVARLPPIAWP